MQQTKTTILHHLKETSVQAIAVAIAGWLVGAASFLGIIGGIMVTNRPPNEIGTGSVLDQLSSTPTLITIFTMSTLCLLFSLFSIPVYGLLQKKVEALDFERMYRELPALMKEAMYLYQVELAKDVGDYIAFHRLMERLRSDYPNMKQELLTLAGEISRLSTTDFTPLTAKMSELKKLIEAVQVEAEHGGKTLEQGRQTVSELGPQVRDIQSHARSHTIMADYVLKELERMTEAVRQTLPASPEPTTNVVSIRPGE